MFTGIIQQVGAVSDVETTKSGRRLVIEGSGMSSLPVGASISVDGVCLTAVEVDEDRVVVDVVPETLERTTLGQVESGDAVNLELAMPASGRFDGHIVQGHVDGVGSVAAIDRSDGATVMTITPPERLLDQIVEKGSIAVDGVSLTVAGMSGPAFSVALIPHTLDVTTLGLRKPGDAVNLETDIIAKYVGKLTGATQ